ncbi:MDR family MFS transporter [Thaumasiovibrio subtropicus]|uniref:MDR family MFS transporter n=1 Tax=Thaumasiovibrio subtropicus TaxID=1891207 RepID=UPI000B35CFB3|nr:MFS transporter [Thaumasiovibrio subtropicus]
MANQDSLFQWQRIQRFNFPIWTILTGVLLARTSYFMAWPFLIIFLYQDYGASATQVGAMLAASALVGAVAGLYSGYLSDKFGRKWVMVLGSWIAAASYTGIALADQIWQFYILLMFTGLMRPMIEAPSKAVIGDNLADLKDRELALNIRYFLLNIGGAFGPLIGVTLALSEPQNLFFITGATYVVYSVWLLIGIERTAKPDKPDSSQLPHFFATLRVISKDKIFVLLMMANFLMMFVYAQLDSSIPQIIVRSNQETAGQIIPTLVLVNTLTIILFQFPMLKWLENVPLFARTRLGMVLMAISQIGFMLSPTDSLIGLGIACFILSLGEVVAFPTLNVQIDRLAPAHLRGSYFGATALYSLGFAVSPLVGGMIIESLSAFWLFAVCLLFCAMMFWLYWRAEHTEDLVQRSSPLTEQ